MKLYKISANVGTQYVVKLKEVEVRRYGSKYKEVDGPTLVRPEWIDTIRPKSPMNVDGHVGVRVWFTDPTMVDYWKWKVHNAMLDQLAIFKAELFAKILLVSNGPSLTVEGNDEKPRGNTLPEEELTGGQIVPKGCHNCGRQYSFSGHCSRCGRGKNWIRQEAAEKICRNCLHNLTAGASCIGCGGKNWTPKGGEDHGKD